MEVELKLGRSIVHVSEKDIIMDNDACLQIITQFALPRMSRKLFNSLKARGFIVTNAELDQYAANRYDNRVKLYAFNIPEMAKAGYETKG